MGAYLSEQKLPNLGRVLDLPDDLDADGLPLPPYLILTFMLPNYPPAGLLGNKRTNGPGWTLVACCRLSEEIRAELREGRSHAAIDLLRRFMDPVKGAHLRGQRLKVILGICDASEPGYNLVTKQLVQSYNNKPFLSKTASSFYLEPGKYFEINIDVHLWGATPLNALSNSGVKTRMPKTSLRCGIVVEAETDEEMPEQMLLGCVLSYIDPFRAAEFPPELASFLLDERHQKLRLPTANK